MSYIGNTPTSQAFAPGTDTFSGTGSQTAFTLSRSVSTVNDILVVVNNVEQQPSNYTVSGTTLTFSPAPSSGTNNIYVRYLSTNLLTVAPQQGSVVPSSLSTGGPTWDTSSNLQFNSGYGSVATAYGCRAWVNFNGTGTLAVRASANVSSVTDNSVGNYIVNFTNAMPDANYSGSFCGNGLAQIPVFYSPATTSTQVLYYTTAGTAVDVSICILAIFR